MDVTCERLVKGIIEVFFGGEIVEEFGNKTKIKIKLKRIFFLTNIKIKKNIKTETYGIW